VYFQLTGDERLAVEELRWQLAGGTVSAEPFSVGSGALELDMTLHAAGLDLDQVFALTRLDGLSGEGRIAGGVNGTHYRLENAEVNHRFKRVLGERIKLQEERSKDKETKHKEETVSVMTLGRGLFAQQSSNRERDTTAIRRR